MEEFFTRQKSNEGIRFPLFLPDGSPTEHWLLVLGIDSDAFKEAEIVAKRAMIEASKIDDDKARLKEIRQIEIRWVASLIADWSFDLELTQESAVKLFTEAPQIYSEVDKIISDRRLYYQKKQKSSASTSPRKSNSKKRRQAQK